MKKLSILALVILFAMTSCQKDRGANSSGSYSNVKHTADLNVPAGFDWRTTQNVTLDLSPFAENSKYAQSIKVEDVRGNLLISKVMKVTPTSTLQFKLPKSDRSVIVIHNGAQDEFAVNGTRANMPLAKKSGSKGSKGKGSKGSKDKGSKGSKDKGSKGKGSKGSKGSKGGNGSGCACDGKMQNFTVSYNGPSGVTVEAQDSKSGTPFQTFTNVQNGALLLVDDPNNVRLGPKTDLIIGNSSWEVHTSCSQAILGLTYGDFTVTSYTDGNGAVCGGAPPCVDSDNDGCCDKDDAFPNDPTKCDVQYDPGPNTYGSYAWEDLWPSTGDFDFNDKVIDRNTALILDNNGDVIQARYKFLLRAAGAGYSNGLGFRMPGVPKNDVSSVTGTVNAENYTTIDPNGTEAGQTDAVIIVYENWKNHVTITSGTTFFNTVPGPSGGVGTSDTIIVEVIFNTPQPVMSLLDIDPFLIANIGKTGNRGVEIHLPWFGPTALANTALFGTAQDASAYPGAGNNYVTSGNIPWAIETPLDAFDWPIELADITTVYYDFSNWAMTGTPTNWYSNGNRDASKIY